MLENVEKTFLEPPGAGCRKRPEMEGALSRDQIAGRLGSRPAPPMTRLHKIEDRLHGQYQNALESQIGSTVSYQIELPVFRQAASISASARPKDELRSEPPKSLTATGLGLTDR
ncbi:hypothetical protein ACOJBM_04180 [Rhizobium beringeri]